MVQELDIRPIFLVYKIGNKRQSVPFRDSAKNSVEFFCYGNRLAKTEGHPSFSGYFRRLAARGHHRSCSGSAADAGADGRAFPPPAIAPMAAPKPAPIPILAASFFVLFWACFVNPSVCTAKHAAPSDVFSRTSSSCRVASPANFSAGIRFGHPAFHFRAALGDHCAVDDYRLIQTRPEAVAGCGSCCWRDGRRRER